jgi:hypothetical protein
LARAGTSKRFSKAEAIATTIQSVGINVTSGDQRAAIAADFANMLQADNNCGRAHVVRPLSRWDNYETIMRRAGTVLARFWHTQGRGLAPEIVFRSRASWAALEAMPFSWAAADDAGGGSCRLKFVAAKAGPNPHGRNIGISNGTRLAAPGFSAWIERAQSREMVFNICLTFRHGVAYTVIDVDVGTRNLPGFLGALSINWTVKNIVDRMCQPVCVNAGKSRQSLIIWPWARLERLSKVSMKGLFNVRFWGQSGHGFQIAKCPLMTQSGHEPDL